ncbi:hypothetical protein A2U01_0004298 [Trifolium medium]|uniref:Uncharacterized protein n=1 Tax=Trifolium medium TaxID=97028 RepID=A0A392M7S9_9FABA|nr:hypothetical protein [Trifolium medium]
MVMRRSSGLRVWRAVIVRSGGGFVRADLKEMVVVGGDCEG